MVAERTLKHIQTSNVFFGNRLWPPEMQVDTPPGLSGGSWDRVLALKWA